MGLYLVDNKKVNLLCLHWMFNVTKDDSLLLGQETKQEKFQRTGESRCYRLNRAAYARKFASIFVNIFNCILDEQCNKKKNHSA